MTNMYMKKKIELFKTIREHEENKKKVKMGGERFLPIFKPCPFGKGITII
jgi:hypothetical protein